MSSLFAINPLHTGKLYISTLASSEDLDEMQQNVTFFRVCTICVEKNLHGLKCILVWKLTPKY